MERQTNKISEGWVALDRKQLGAVNGGIFFETVMATAIIGGVAWATMEKLREIEAAKKEQG